MTVLYDPAKIRALAATGDPFYMGAWWVLRQQEAAQLTGHRAAFMSDKISMDEARVKARRANWDDDWTPVPRTAARGKIAS